MIIWLQNWFLQHCDGAWEHEHQIQIMTTDNPGWSVIIDITDTEAEGTTVPYTLIENEEEDWIGFLFDGIQFRGGCSVLNLEKLIEKFKERIVSL
ncbi:MAG: immunity 53 family protein [Candidatus Pseudobacter hemicellulosilyticus]|uniref:Immunity 53 family protein n=1 Tax=Candidatus Pseudobacter hemicellulosilyticus TaxID=3121375 RepID=A0AAJ5WSG0_9BACT|nr:MAG: immunity 53 family protein [Pseudobacter sp.]